MTQPPNQPPAGGFGAPQDPQAPQTPPPPAGPPQTPPPAGPPQPGYGYPQQPGPYGAPQQPGPYGQPTQQQPGPYGQPQQPGPYAQQPGPYGQQPQYGYPPQQQPGAPVPPQGGGGGGGIKGKTWAIAAGALALVLVAGGVVFAVVGGDDDGKTDPKKPTAKGKDPKASASAPVNPGDGQGDGHAGDEDLNAGREDGEAKVLWYKTAPKVPGDGADAPGMWITDKVAVKAAYKEVLAYDVADGKISWPAVSFPQKICSVTKNPSADGKIVVAYKSGVSSRAKCNQVQEIDLATGKKGWSAKIPERENKDDFFDGTSSQIGLNYAGDTLMVGRQMSGLGLDAKTGKKKFVVEQYGNDCFPKAYTGDAKKLLTVASCGAGGDNAHEELRQLDPATGKALWTKKFPKDWQISNVYSVSPLVVYSTNDDDKKYNIASFKENSATVQAEVGVDGLDTKCGSSFSFLNRDLSGCAGAVTDASTLYMPTDGKAGGANEVVAISLTSGKERWRVKSPEDQTLLPVKVENGGVVTYMQASYGGQAGRVLNIPIAKPHTPKTLLQNPAGTAAIESGFYSKDVAYADGRFYISATNLSGSAKGQQKLMLAYGD
ncbi:PQQ-binding-like beta-propeller repeat protein [Streptomyces sp. SID5785]|uniref:outer membrane protein assembly factor BamB family protein n=1 Tax=Streptomyces sp. SID5785 TaxID=2690309 RepID=UPI001361E95C|nr:PQQ-binding-like beta-propeller repeat protein [Streptomyces sp. SID5785]MZD07598.1 PQQ-binding-like beta-propeller repeat protein [Streptomyces sp. SID5785]